MTAKATESPFVSSLDSLASAGRRWLWKSHVRDGLRARMPAGLALFLVVPVLALAVTAAGWVLGRAWRLPAGWTLALCPLPPALYLVWTLLSLCRKRPRRREGLAVFDELLDLKDRLQTADEFLTLAQPTPFMEAAIEDAAPALEKAGRTSLDWDWGRPWTELRRLTVVPLLAVLLLLLGVLLPVFSRTGAAPVEPEQRSVELAGDQPLPPETRSPVPVRKPPVSPRPGQERPEDGLRKGTKGEPSTAEIAETPSSRLTGRDKISLGTSEGSQTSQATSSGRASQASGMPGSQAPSGGQPKTPDGKQKDKKPKEVEAPDSKRKKVEDRSGTTAGLGSSSGSSRNPASSEGSGKDRTEAEDNEEFEQEEDVNDEESESEARGGLQPNLRDRRPPVNRDLSIGFGNRASSDSNGRGGPGDRKKSRGVASLVLGVPIPDHVKGQPNPGRVKVNQERVRPQGEDMPRGVAEDRGRRSSPAGHLSERALDAPTRDIVREFFLSTRAADAARTTPGETLNR
jgi:hypothetical protein